jgi:hypothetical protein
MPDDLYHAGAGPRQLKTSTSSPFLYISHRQLRRKPSPRRPVQSRGHAGTFGTFDSLDGEAV